jgi:flagellar biosynthesis chaperone FliJ
VAAALKAKEAEGSKKVYEMQVQSLENTIEKNKEQIDKLSAELKEALTQVQSLSLTALENTVKGGKNKSSN